MLNQGRPSVTGPGGVRTASLADFRERHRLQELSFQMAATLTRQYRSYATCEAPSHVLFPQMLGIVRRYLDEKVNPVPPAERIDALLVPISGGSSNGSAKQSGRTPKQARRPRCPISTGTARP